MVLRVVDGEMDSTIPTPTTSSTVTASEISLPPPALYILDISLISAQDLAPVSKSMRTYAITWIHHSRKLTTRVNQQGHTNPLWNDRFAFRVDSEFLSSDPAVTVEIYTVSWFRDVIVGTVRVLISDLINPSARNNTRYVALQIRRPSGNPQGILNMGVALMDATKRSMPLYRELNPLIIDYDQDRSVKKLNSMSVQQKAGEVVPEEDDDHVNEKIHLWRSYSVGNEFNEEFPLKAGSVCNGYLVNGNGNESLCNGSTANGSELCSDVGPSASIVAAQIAMKSLPPMAEKKGWRPAAKAELAEEKEFGSSILEDMTVEEATAKGLKSNLGRLRKEVSLPPKHEGKFERSKSDAGGHARRHSDGGLFSCFGNAYGFEFTIVCGASGSENKPNNVNKSRSQKRRFIGSESNSA